MRLVIRVTSSPLPGASFTDLNSVCGNVKYPASTPSARGGRSAFGPSRTGTLDGILTLPELAPPPAAAGPVLGRGARPQAASSGRLRPTAVSPLLLMINARLVKE